MILPHWVSKLAAAGKCSLGGVNGRLYARRNGSHAASRHCRAAVKNAFAPSGVLCHPGRGQARLARPAFGSWRMGWSASFRILAGWLACPVVAAPPAGGVDRETSVGLRVVVGVTSPLLADVGVGAGEDAAESTGVSRDPVPVATTYTSTRTSTSSIEPPPYASTYGQAGFRGGRCGGPGCAGGKWWPKGAPWPCRGP